MVLLLLLARLATALLGDPVAGAWFQSPVSPVTPTAVPATPTLVPATPTPTEALPLPTPTSPPTSATATPALPTTTPLLPSPTATMPAPTPTASIVLPSISSGSSPLQPPVPQPQRSPLPTPSSRSPLSDPGIWSSPLPWAAIGVLFFGGMAWLVITIARHVGSGGSR